MDMLSQSPAADLFLCQAYNRISGVGDVGAAEQMLFPEFGWALDRKFVPETPTRPFFTLFFYPNVTVALLSGVARPSHGAAIANGYLDADASPFATGCNSAMAKYASDVWDWFAANPTSSRKPVIVFGSSMGAGAGCILTRIMRYRLGNVRIRCATIGSPKVFKSQNWGRLPPYQEVLWQNENDPVCSILPQLSEKPAFYLFLPTLVTIQLLRFTHRAQINYLRQNGDNPTMIASPWDMVSVPTDLPSLINFSEELFVRYHHSQVYVSRLMLCVARLLRDGGEAMPANPQPEEIVRADLRDLAAVGITPSNTPRGQEAPIANSGGLDDVRHYRIKRRGHRYLLLRGKFSLGAMISKSAARRIARIGNVMMRPTFEHPIPDPYQVDEALKSGYPVYFETVA